MMNEGRKVILLKLIADGTRKEIKKYATFHMEVVKSLYMRQRDL